MLAALIPTAHELLRHLGWILLHFGWQGALIAATYALICAAHPQLSPTRRYWFGNTALLLMILCLPLTGACLDRRVAQVHAVTNAPNVIRSSASQLVLPGASASSASVHNEAIELPLQADAPESGSQRVGWQQLNRWLPWLAGGWLVGVTCLSLRLARGFFGIRRLRRSGRDVGDDGLQGRCQQFARQLRISKPVKLLQSAAVEVPTVFGWMRPTILVPASALTSLTALELDALLVHELAHVRRYDYPLNVLQTIIETLLYYHPAVWWISARVRQDRELCCDDLALSLCRDRYVYARALANMEQLRIQIRTPALAARGGTLLARIRRVLGVPPPQRTRARVLGIAALAPILMIAVVLLALPWKSAAQQNPQTDNQRSNEKDDADEFFEIGLFATTEGELARIIANGNSVGNDVDRLEAVVKDNSDKPISKMKFKLLVDHTLKHEVVVGVLDELASFDAANVWLVGFDRIPDDGSSHVNISVLDQEGRPTKSVHLNLWIKVPEKCPAADVRWSDGQQTWERIRNWSPIYPQPEPFGFHDIPAGKYRVTAAQCLEDGPRDPSPFAASDPIEVKENETVEVQLRFAGDHPLKIRVIDEQTTQPLENVALRLYRADGAPIVYGNGSGNFFEHTNDEGAVQYRHLTSGQYEIEIIGRRATPWELIDYEPLAERIPVEIRQEASEEIEVKLTRHRLSADEIAERFPFAIRGTVRDADGNPLADAQIRVHAGIGTLKQTGQTVTAEDGTYEVRFLPGMYFSDHKWGAGLQVVQLSAEKEGYERTSVSELAMAAEKPADDEGHWYKGLVLPNQPYEQDMMLKRAEKQNEGQNDLDDTDGGAAAGVIPLRGATIVGQIDLPLLSPGITFQLLTIKVSPPAPHIGFPGDDERWKQYGEFLNSEEGRRYQRDGIPVDADGTFRVENLPAAEYDLHVVLSSERGGAPVRYIGFRRIEVPSTMRADHEPLDIGSIQVQ